MPTTEPHTPIARARSRGSVKTLVTIDMATGLSIVPPRPCSARAAMSHPMDGARLHSSEPAPKRPSPTWKVRRRPTRSPVAPASMRKHARTSV